MSSGRWDRIVVTMAAIVFGLLSGLAIVGAAFPYGVIRGWLNSIAADGDAGGFAPSTHRKLWWMLVASGCLTSLATLVMIRRFRTLTWAIAAIRRSMWADCKSLYRSIFGSWAIQLALAIVSLVYVFMVVPELDAPIRSDEAYTYINYCDVPAFITVTRYDAPNNHIFHSILVHLVTRLCGESVICIRIVACLSGWMTVVLLMVWLATRYHVSAASVAGLMLVTNPTFLEYSVNARGYTLSTLALGVAVWAAVTMAVRPHLPAALLAIAGGTLALYTIPTNVYALAMIYGGWLIGCLVIERSTKLGSGSERIPSLEPTTIALESAQVPHCVSLRNCLGAWMLCGLITGLATVAVYLPVLATMDPQLLRSLASSNAASRWDTLERAGEYWPQLVDWFFWRVPTTSRILVVTGIVIGGLFAIRNRVMLAVGLACASIATLLPVMQNQLPPERSWFFLVPTLVAMATVGWFHLLLLGMRAYATAGMVILGIVISVPTGYGIIQKPLFIENRQCDFPQSEAIAHWLTHNTDGDAPIIMVTPCAAPIQYQMMRRNEAYNHFFVPGAGHTDDDDAVLVASNAFAQEPINVLAELGLDAMYAKGSWEIVREFETARIFRFRPQP